MFVLSRLSFHLYDVTPNYDAVRSPNSSNIVRLHLFLFSLSLFLSLPLLIPRVPVCYCVRRSRRENREIPTSAARVTLGSDIFLRNLCSHDATSRTIRIDCGAEYFNLSFVFNSLAAVRSVRSRNFGKHSCTPSVRFSEKSRGFATAKLLRKLSQSSRTTAEGEMFPGEKPRKETLHQSR